MSLVEEATAIAPGLIELRRELHQVPEVGLELPKTQALVLDAMAGLPLEITTGKELTSVVGVLRGGRPGPTVLLRGDMDALPVVEETGLAYASQNGNMHACGHDLHTTGLVGAAQLLSAHRDELSGNVIFMFQPGEEGLGGAGYMLREGLLSATGDKPIAAYALHVWSQAAKGTFQLRPGTIMASSNQLHITVHGKGGHGSTPDRTIDPVPVVAELVLALQTYATRRVNVFDPVVITVTQLEAGVAINVIPNTARLGATVRTLSDAMLEQLTRELPALAERIAAAHGCTVDARLDPQYPVTVNDAGRTAETASILTDLFGAERVQQLDNPLMGAEDFSMVLREVPGTFVMVGARPDDVSEEEAPSNHSSLVRFDDAVLADQAAALAQLAAKHLMPA
ncbi:hippurate hydrolase [Kribbella sp. VKM Ac-2571]|uniref:M20 metallopeptidase family protein n=1 Tax=Kribbella sp. VKM Ac-2571 TaxID=2512222 RepID=UPI00105CAA38|nr:M20 family metallopeptidase [Kribbella sp. VKM Ac-2571]TDO67411.1 hippurate hydrolase [Kribbella sp. VKM Ac-2571]